MFLTLHKEIEFEGKTIANLNLDLESITGDDLMAIESQVRQEMASQGEILHRPELSTKFLIAVGAKAAGVPVELLGRLSAPDFIAVKAEVQNFLLP